MRLLFCTTDGAGSFNGINAWFLEFLPALAASGHQVSVLVFSWSPSRDCQTHLALLERGIPSQVVFPMLYTEAAIRRCVREVADFKPDVFIPSHVVPALLAMPAVRAHGIPSISILHNDDVEYRAKALFPADATVAVSERLLALIPPDGRLARNIPYCVPLSPRLAAPPRPDAPFRIVYHGRIAHRQKRIVETAAALARVCRLYPSVQADIFGSGPDEADLRAQLERDDAGGRVRFLGPRTVAELRALLPDFHASILLSEFEGLPVSVLESMSAGLVPVCLRIDSGLPELIRPGENGFLLDNREHALDEAIGLLLHDASAWSRLALGARTTVEARFSPGAGVRSWEQLFQDLLVLPARAAASPSALPPIHPDLLDEDQRHPGLPRAVWRWLRFGPAFARLPW